MIIIDAGHGGKDVGGGGNGDFLEKDMSLKMSLLMKDRFQVHGVKVLMTREDDIYLSPTDRARIVKESGAKHCISNHINAAVPSARGAEVIHSIYTTDVLARRVLQSLSTIIQPRRVFTRTLEANPKKDYYYMNRDTGSVNTHIIEYGFATNEEDSKIIQKRWRDMVEAVVKVYLEWLGVTYIPPKAEEVDGNKTFIVNVPRETKQLIVNFE